MKITTYIDHYVIEGKSYRLHVDYLYIGMAEESNQVIVVAKKGSGIVVEDEALSLFRFDAVIRSRNDMEFVLRPY